MKPYRVDTFYGKTHIKIFFDFEKDALSYGKLKAKEGRITFLLRHVCDGKYDVVREIQ